MVWAKRRFKRFEDEPYKARILELMMADLDHYNQFIMVSKHVSPSLSEYYVGVPTEILLVRFDGFEPVAESDVPTVIDHVHIAAANCECSNRFELRSHQ
jgi:hypothetical protein